MTLEKLLVTLMFSGKRELIGYPGSPGLVRSDLARKIKWVEQAANRADWRVYTDNDLRPWLEKRWYFKKQKPCIHDGKPASIGKSFCSIHCEMCHTEGRGKCCGLCKSL